MKTWLILGLGLLSQFVFADNLPVFTLQPTNFTAYLNTNNIVSFQASAVGATSYQWHFNGIDILNATNATFQVAPQPTNSGYFSVIAKNNTGWVPSQLAYLFIHYTLGSAAPGGAGQLALSNTNNTYLGGQVAGIAGVTGIPTNGAVQIVAGPELDEMQPLGLIVRYRPTNSVPPLFNNGYYQAPDQAISNIAPGQVVYYSVIAKYTNNGIAYTQPSTIINLTAGTNGLPAPLPDGLKFPGWPEWPEPILNLSPATNQLRVVGETVSFTNVYSAYQDYGVPTIQWRKDGRNIPGATNFIYTPFQGGQTVFAITNLQPADAGAYDAIIFGNDWEVSPKIYLSIQITNGQGVFQNPHFNGTNFVSDLVGASGRNYKIQGSTNLLNWTDLFTISNATGTTTFTNPSTVAQFFRSMLLP